MNIYDLLDFIRKNDNVGEYSEVADAIMRLYLIQRITSPTVLRMYAEIVFIMIKNTSPYGVTVKGSQDSQGV